MAAIWSCVKVTGSPSTSPSTRRAAAIRRATATGRCATAPVSGQPPSQLLPDKAVNGHATSCEVDDLPAIERKHERRPRDDQSRIPLCLPVEGLDRSAKLLTIDDRREDHVERSGPA